MPFEFNFLHAEKSEIASNECSSRNCAHRLGLGVEFAQSGECI